MTPFTGSNGSSISRNWKSIHGATEGRPSGRFPDTALARAIHCGRAPSAMRGRVLKFAVPCN